MDGIALAKKHTAHKGKKLNPTIKQVQVIKGRVKPGDKKSRIASDFFVSRETLYQYLRQ